MNVSWKLTPKPGHQIYLDDLRVMATVFVIGVHTVSLAASMVEEGSISYHILECFDYFFLSCNLLFLMISGALLLSVRGEKTTVFFRKRFSKVVIPFLVYYILYVCAKEGIEWIYPSHWLPLLQRIVSGAPVEAPHFWLIYVILFLYVLTPALRWILAHIPDAVLSGFLAVLFVLCTIDTYAPLFGMSAPFQWYTGTFVGTFVLGYYLAAKCSRRMERIFFAGGVVSFLISCLWIVTRNDYKDYIYQNAPTMMLFAAMLFLLVKRKAAGKTEELYLVSLISRHSYSILLIHWGILHFVVKQVLHVNVLGGGIVGGCILMLVLTLVLSTIAAWILDKTLLKWLMV